MKGKVFIVGAGPGDIGLITAKGLACLRKAEVVVYDFHLNAQVLNYINHDAEFIYAGKRGGHHSMKQDDINHALISKAKQGKIVCRLKGGDPFVFGRGGEEAFALAEGGIDFEIVPGISSAVAAPAYAGIPLTHRLYSSSVAIIPGYEDVTKPDSSIDWSKLATGVDTLVILMTIKNIALVCRKLIDHGRRPETPVAVIRWGTRPDQTTLVSTLENITSLVRERDIKPPAVMVIGEVVRLRGRLRWYEKKPLFGQRILVTREHSGGFEQLEDYGAEIIEFPTIEVVEPESWKGLDEALGRIDSYDWLVFTSANGVHFFLRRLIETDRDIRDLKGVRICAVGAKTAEALKTVGIRVDLVPDEFNAEGLLRVFTSECSGRYRRTGEGAQSNVQSLKGTRILMPRAEVARDVFPAGVRDLGGHIDVVPVYRTVKPDVHGRRLKRFLREGRISVATFTSAATFDNFLSIMKDDVQNLLKDVAIAVIGPVTARAVERAGLRVDIMPGEATIEAMAAHIVEWIVEHRHACPRQT